MSLCKSLQATACVFFCGAALVSAQQMDRPVPIANAMETTVIDGGLGTAPPIDLPRVENVNASDAAADLSRPFTQTTTAHQSSHLASKILKIGLASVVPVNPSMFTKSSSMDAPPSNGKFSFKRMVRKTAVETAEPEPTE